MQPPPPPPPAPAHAPHLRRRVDAVTRLLGGEPADVVAAELGVPARELEAWAKEFCRAGEQRLRQLPDNWFERFVTGAEKLVPLATLLSVVIAAVLFVQGQRKAAADQARAQASERETRVRDAYTALDDRYLDYVKLCLDHPDLDVFDTPLPHPGPASPEQHRRESMVLSVLFSILERSYLMFGDPADAFERAQWSAWSAYISSWAARPNFRAEWTVNHGQFDAGFTAYVDGLIAATPATSRPAEPLSTMRVR